MPNLHRIRLSTERLPVLAAIGVCLFFNASISSVTGAEPAPGTYRAIDGKVDRGTFDGWLTYHTACHVCHGPDATGSDIAPDLRQSIKSMTPVEFTSKVLTRYRIFVTPTESMSSEQRRQSVIDEVIRQQRGARGTVSMPAWQSNPEIKPHVLDLYAYLKARSDNALGPGRPSVIDSK
jgi:mono/diheme cytochrome c family protein